MKRQPKHMTRDQIIAALDRMEPWQARVMCASAAQRVAPLFRKLASRTSRSAFDDGLASAWNSAISGRGRPMRRALLKLPEARQHDSHAPEYFAGRALEVLYRAVDFVANKDVETAKSCIAALADVCDGIDTALTSAPGQTYRYDPKHPPPPGKLERQELEAQAEVIALLRDAALDTRTVTAFMRLARKRASIYAAIIPRLVARIGII